VGIIGTKGGDLRLNELCPNSLACQKSKDSIVPIMLEIPVLGRRLWVVSMSHAIFSERLENTIDFMLMIFCRDSILNRVEIPM
jgi:hypothetical protein